MFDSSRVSTFNVYEGTIRLRSYFRKRRIPAVKLDKGGIYQDISYFNINRQFASQFKSFMMKRFISISGRRR